MIVETESHNYLDEFIVGLPFVALVKWSITPLTTFQSAADTMKKIPGTLNI